VPHLAPPADPASLLADRDLLYVDGHEPAAAGVLATAARARDLPVVMDAGTVRAGSRELVALCSDVVSSRRFAPELTGTDDPGEALRRLRQLGPERVALTSGPDGVLALDGDLCRGVPAFAVDAVDTTGAGDVFHAGYAFARAEGRSFVDCLRWGAAVAALKCRDFGGRRALPDRAEVEHLLRHGRTRPCAGIVAAADEAGP
jgi:sugar/nucleoside kinase (ribokinase family)